MNKLWMAAGAGLFFLFLMGIYIGLPRMLDSGQPPGQITQGRPAIEDARKSPSPEARRTSSPRSPGTTTPGTPRQPSPEVSVAWVIQDGAPAHQLAAPTAAKVFTLRYGDKVRPMDRKGSWDRVLLPDGRPAWVQHAFLSSVRPSDLPQEGEAGAVRMVNGFYKDINDKNLSSAYNRLSFDWKKALPFTTFSNGYAATTGATCTVTGVTPMDATHVKVGVQLVMAEERNRLSYAGSHVVVLERGEWRLDSGDLSQIEAPHDGMDDVELE